MYPRIYHSMREERCLRETCIRQDQKVVIHPLLNCQGKGAPRTLGMFQSSKAGSKEIKIKNMADLKQLRCLLALKNQLWFLRAVDQG